MATVKIFINKNASPADFGGNVSREFTYEVADVIQGPACLQLVYADGKTFGVPYASLSHYTIL